MLDLDKYINNSIRIKMEMAKIEENLTEDNLHEKRLEAGLLLLNHNKQKKEFTKEELSALPFEALTRVTAEVALLRLKADQDPNSESQSQTEK